MVWKDYTVSLISNDCIGARFYQVNGIQFNNPFMWSSIRFDDYVTFIERFDKLNLDKAEFMYDHKLTTNGSKSCLCVIDSSVNIHYIHFVEDSTLNEGVIERPNTVDRICSNAIEYTKDKYFERLSREHGEYIFLFTTYYCNFNHDVSKILDSLRRIKAASEVSGVKVICLVNESYKINKQDYSSDKIIIDTYSNDDFTENGTINAMFFLRNITTTINNAIDRLCQK